MRAEVYEPCLWSNALKGEGSSQFDSFGDGESGGKGVGPLKREHSAGGSLIYYLNVSTLARPSLSFYSIDSLSRLSSISDIQNPPECLALQRTHTPR